MTTREHVKAKVFTVELTGNDLANILASVVMAIRMMPEDAGEKYELSELAERLMEIMKQKQ